MRELYYPSSLSRHTKYRWSYKDAIPKKDTSIKAYLQRIDKMLPLHIHDFYELNIIISGDGRHYIGNRNVPTQKGDVFIIPPDISHGYFTDGSLDILHVLLSNTFMHRYSLELRRLSGYRMLFEIEPVLRCSVDTKFYLALSKAEAGDILRLTDEILAENKRSDSDAGVLQEFSVLQLLGRLCEHMSASSINGVGNTMGLKAVSVIKSIEFIENHFADKTDFHAIAADCGMSYSTYLRSFKQLTGITPSRHLCEYRIKHSMELLLFTDHTVLDIALSSGFYDSAHFVREFRAAVGMSPSEYRKHNRVKA
jgi:AraC-like DNA-binding protein/mannose-6-phosphate isomerase-like protein (cupin superfamily)